MKTTRSWKAFAGLVLHALLAGIMILSASGKLLGSPACVIKGNRAKLDVPGADFWYVENGKIKEFNCYVNVNVLLEQMGIQPDFASAVRAKWP